jgi:hypothetical protein
VQSEEASAESVVWEHPVALAVTLDQEPAAQSVVPGRVQAAQSATPGQAPAAPAESDGLPQEEESESAAKLPVAKRLAERSRLEDVRSGATGAPECLVAPDQERLAILAREPQEYESDVLECRGITAAILDPGREARVGLDELERREHQERQRSEVRNNTKFLHVQEPYAFFIQGVLY